MQLRTFLALGGVVLLISGCAPRGVLLRQQLVEEDEVSLSKLKAGAQVGTSIDAYNMEPDETKLKGLRNNFIFNRSALIDMNFLTYVLMLSGDKRAIDSATEGAQLALSVAATLVGSAQAKENLAATIALITGGKAIVDKNYFENKALPALITTMVANRKMISARILTGATMPASVYSIDQARRDLNEYEQAGSIDGAFLIIQSEAIVRDKAATEELKSAQEVLLRNLPTTLTPASKNKRAALYDAIRHTNKLTIEQTQAALTELDFKNIPSSLDQQAALLRHEIATSLTPDQLDRLDKAFKKAGIPK